VPIFFQHQVNETTRLGIWKIEETEEFFLTNVPLQKEVTHPHKRLQHLAGRFLLQFLFPGFPYELIKIADTRKPYLPNEQYHFSISHCGDYAAAIVSNNQRVGIDIEIPSPKVEKIMDKFLSKREQEIFNTQSSALNSPFFAQSALTTHNSQLTTHNLPTRQAGSELLTLLWSAKEAIYKWNGDGGVDFRKHILLDGQHEGEGTINCLFTKTNERLTIHYRYFEHLVLAWVIS
jgi:phosphopantetheinyl transferase